MKYTIDPRQSLLFDSTSDRLSSVAKRQLTDNWPAAFRSCILELMPVEKVGKRFSKNLGRRTKELYSMCGLLLIMEFENWTTERGAEAYMFDRRVQFALNLGADNLSMTTRTIERYRRIFREEKLGKEIFDQVTSRLIQMLDLKVAELRLDSTHVCSDMARLGRIKLIKTVISRFLVQLKRHNAASYSELSVDFRSRYDKGTWEFGNGNSDKVTVELVAGDLHELIGRFENDTSVNGRTTFKNMVRVFFEQCEVVDKKIVIRKKTGGGTLQNPSDPDATYDAKKGAGHKAQTAETCANENDVQLTVAVIPQTAVDHDQNAVEPILEELQRLEESPCSLVADSAYGSDANYQRCAAAGINLISPLLPGNANKELIPLDDFAFDESSCVTSCPNGQTPISGSYDRAEGKGNAIFDRAVCTECPLAERCRARPGKRGTAFRLNYDARLLRNIERRAEMKQPETIAKYAMRSGIEATYGAGKRANGLGRLRVRGRAAVDLAVYLKFAGINILRAANSKAFMKEISEILDSLGFDGKIDAKLPIHAVTVPRIRVFWPPTALLVQRISNLQISC